MKKQIFIVAAIALTATFAAYNKANAQSSWNTGTANIYTVSTTNVGIDDNFPADKRISYLLTAILDLLQRVVVFTG